MSEDTINQLANYLQILSTGFMESRIFLTAVELKIFELLNKQKLTSVEVAERIKTDERATDILLNALVGMKLLEKKEDGFVNPIILSELFCPDSPNYLGGFGFNVHQWEAWSQLTHVVKTGRPANCGWTDEIHRDFSHYLDRQSKNTAQLLTRYVDFSTVNTVMDLGCGSGASAISIAITNRHIKFVLFDKNERALTLARQAIVKEDLKDRVILRRGDFFVDNFGNGYDMVLLSSVICLFNEKQNLALLQRVWNSLASGGNLIILDSFVDSSLTRPSTSTIFSVNMLITSEGGRSHSYPQVIDWLRGIGFEHTHRIPLKGFQMMIAKKNR